MENQNNQDNQDNKINLEKEYQKLNEKLAKVNALKTHIAVTTKSITEIAYTKNFPPVLKLIPSGNVGGVTEILIGMNVFSPEELDELRDTIREKLKSKLRKLQAELENLLLDK